MKTSDFIQFLRPPAQVINASDRLFASVNLAQIALETGWLAHLPRDIHSGRNSFNIYGIKGAGPAGSVFDYTIEYNGGVWVTVLAEFAAFTSYLQSMRGQIAFLKRNPRYAPVFKAKNAYAQAYALQDCGWATDPKYAEKLVAIIKANRLTRFDRPIRQKV